MKPHLLIKLRRGEGVPEGIPFWGDVLSKKAGVSSLLTPAINRLLDRYRLPVWVTREFPQTARVWSPSELRHSLDRFYRLILRDDRNIPPSLIEQIELLPEVAYARVGEIASMQLPRVQAASRPVTPDREARESVGLARAHLITRGHPDVVVAVLDTGMNTEHPELDDSLIRGEGRDFVNIIDGAQDFVGDVTGYDAVPEDEWVGHGTHVAGVIGARGDRMSPGVAPRCRMLNVRVLGALRQGDRLVGAGLADNVSVALKWVADRGVDVVNMSLGVQRTGSAVPYDDVVAYARERGVTVVAASGNDGRRTDLYPGAIPSVITVGAVDPEGEVASFSTYGDQIDLVAPGTEIYSAFLKDEHGKHGYAFSSGTSHAAPFVSGAVALMKSLAAKRGGTLRDAEIQDVLRQSSDKLDRRYKHPRAGYGRLNLPDALALTAHRLN